jgi:hypothetical protein
MTTNKKRFQTLSEAQLVRVAGVVCAGTKAVTK